MSLRIVVPVPGTIQAMEYVTDPVFAQGIVGPGLAIEPDAGTQLACAPISGRIMKIFPHAYVIVEETSGRGVLVHLGLDTIELDGVGFGVRARTGDQVSAGQGLIEWDPQEIRDGGRDAICPIVAMEAHPGEITRDVDPGARVVAGDPLMTWL